MSAKSRIGGVAVALVCALLGLPSCARRAAGPAVPLGGADLVSPRKAIAEPTLRREPHLVWNAFVDIVALTPYERLHPRQRPAHLVFWYNAEVQNGGHYQYFENSAGRRAHEAVGALEQLGFGCQANVLKQAFASWTTKARKPPQHVQEFVDNALTGEFDPFDSAFHKCSPTIDRGLESYVAANRELFVVLVGAAQPGVAPDGASPRR